MKTRDSMTTPRRHAGFSLVELLVVILIIAIVLAILIPAIRGVTRTTKQAATMALLSDLVKASSQFTTDNKRAPGYFTAAEMGDSANANRGFNNTWNVMLDLMGGVVPSGTTGGGVINNVGPTSTAQVIVDVDQIGNQRANGKPGGYFNPDRKYLEVDPAIHGMWGPQAALASSDGKHLPMLMDAFGNPIMAWSADSRPTSEFSSEDSNSRVAKFYWNSNAGILKANSTGRSRSDQNAASLVGFGRNASMVANSNNGPCTLEALLGNPAFPKTVSGVKRPESPRGTTIFHSPGADGVFLGQNERGAKVYASTSGAANPGDKALEYHSDVDVATTFDDILTAAGN